MFCPEFLESLALQSQIPDQELAFRAGCKASPEVRTIPWVLPPEGQ